ncbi:MAG: Gfo/Idh/MocA family protein [Beutenbergiaceae bacterium]
MNTAYSTIRVGVLGAGVISQSVHLPSLRRAGFDIRYVCDLSASRAAQVAAAVGSRPTNDPGQVFTDPEVDAVLIATSGSHTELTKSALAHGKHVLAEKPLAFTVRETAEIAQLAQHQQRIVQVGYMKMYDPLTTIAAQEVAAMERLRLVRVTVAHPADEPQVAHLRLPQPSADADPAIIAVAQAYDTDRAREALPGADESLLRYYTDVLNGSVIHEFSLLRALGLGLPERWQAQTFAEGDEPASLLATGTVGQTAYVLSWNWLPDYPEYQEELVALAANARLEFHLAKPYLLEERSRLVSRRHTGELRQDTSYTDGHDTGFIRQLDAFADAIRTGISPDPALSGVAADITALQSLAQAIAAGRGHDIHTETAQP